MCWAVTAFPHSPKVPLHWRPKTPEVPKIVPEALAHHCLISALCCSWRLVVRDRQAEGTGSSSECLQLLGECHSDTEALPPLFPVWLHPLIFGPQILLCCVLFWFGFWFF